MTEADAAIVARAHQLVKKANDLTYDTDQSWHPLNFTTRTQLPGHNPTTPSGQSFNTQESLGRAAWNTVKAPFRFAAAPITAAFKSNPNQPGRATSGIGAFGEALMSPEILASPSGYAKHLWQASPFSAPFNPNSQWGKGIQREMGDSMFQFENSIPTALNRSTGEGADWIRSYPSFFGHHDFTPGWGSYPSDRLSFLHTAPPE